MITATIVDDEQDCCEVLATLLAKYCLEVKILDICYSAETALQSIKEQAPQILFLDVEMPFLNGFELLERLEKITFELIFTTSYDHYAMKAIRFSALEYLLKPIDRVELQNAVLKAVKRNAPPLPQQFEMLLEKMKQPAIPISRIAIPTLEGFQLLQASSVIRCEADGNYTHLFLKGKIKITTTTNLKEMEEMLEDYSFIRVHHSHLVIIIEDEQKAAADLAAQLTFLDPEIEVIATLDSVAGSVNWILNNPTPDLVFMDIHLGDGNCFEIFKQVQISCPVVFCTAYDEYALEAFKLNSIGYIVKPIDRERLAEVLQKYHVLQQHYVPSSLITDTLSRIVQQQPRYKTSFLIPFKNKMVPLPVDAIACIYVKQEHTFIVTADDELLVNKTLEQLQIELDPTLFYRVNRQYIVSFRYIKEIEQLQSRKIGIILSIPYDEPIVVSKDAASGFKGWMEAR